MIGFFFVVFFFETGFLNLLETSHCLFQIIVKYHGVSKYSKVFGKSA